ncbi:MAG: hypothetical protein AB1813_29260, partial [Verrucomicrobiota bacterium]
GYDFLRFAANGGTQAQISGLVDWQQSTWNLGAGLFILNWKYIKDGSVSSGADAGWLDQMTYTIPSFYFTNWIMQANGDFQFNLNGTNGQRLFVESSADLASWTPLQTNTLGSSNYITITIPNALSSPYRFYRALHRNTP